MRLSYTTIFILFSFIFLSGCLKQEYDYKEDHPLYIEHSHDHKDSHDHKTDEVQGEEFEEIIGALEDKERVIWQKPKKVIEMLGKLEGKTVADIGAGTGYFSFLLANEAEKVIAIDIDDRFIQYMDSVKVEFPENIQNKLDIRIAGLDDPKLQKGETDAIILVNTYSYIQNRTAYFKKVAEGMKSGAKLLIVDYKKKRLPEGQGPPVEMRISADSVENELEMAGYRLMETDDTTLEYQYIVLVTKP
ncbi:MAG: ubiquinone/menaquinone biosynthesis C-methylase UbiE [Maribacter sp.]|jgi:ubiquinone/menaquinone biosynthesis C-methylase UbiE